MLKTIGSFIRSTGFVSLFMVSGANVVATLISALALIIFSRVLGPAAFGVFATGFALMLIVVRLVDLGLNPAAEREVARLYGRGLSPQITTYLQLVFWLKALISLGLIGLGLILSGWLSEFLQLDSPGIIRLAFVAAIGTIVYEYLILVFQSTQQFAIVARLTLAQALGKLLMGIILIATTTLTPTTALLVYGFMPLVGALVFLRRLPTAIWRFPRRLNPALRRLLLVARWTAVSVVAASLVDNIDTLLIQKLLGSYEVGLWGAAGRLAGFASIIGWSMGAVLSVRVARYHDRAHLQAYLRKSLYLSLGGFGLVLLGVPLARLGLALTVGPAYLDATIPLILLLISVALTTATTPLSALFYLFDKPAYYGYTGLILAVGVILGNLALLPAYGLVGAGLTKIILRLVLLLFTLWYARRAYRTLYD